MLSPGKHSFFKYAAPDAVLDMLRNQTVRYSSPLEFNDPFDVQTGLHFDFDLNALRGKVLDRLGELAASPDEPQVDAEDAWGQFVLLARQNHPTHGFPRGFWEQMTHDLFDSLVNDIKTLQTKCQEYWSKTLLPGARMFCVTEDRDNLLMWAHYAKDHTGAVFEFLSLPEEDNALSVARHINYSDSPPPFFTEAEWVDSILSIQKLDLLELSKRYVYCKSTHWRYENEWRVWDLDLTIPPTKDRYHDTPIRQSEFAALYIGCEASKPFADDAISLTRKMFPNTKIFRARKKADEYALEYTAITCC